MKYLWGYSFSIINIMLHLTLLEPDAKKMAALVADPLIGIRGGVNSSIGDTGNQAPRITPPAASASMAGVGGICNEDIRVPDKMVGLSK